MRQCFRALVKCARALAANGRVGVYARALEANWRLVQGRSYAARSRAERLRSAAGEAVGDADTPMPLPWSPACPSTKLALKCLKCPPLVNASPKRVSKKLNKTIHTHIPHLSKNSGKRVVREQEPVRVRQFQKITLDDRESQIDRFLCPMAHGRLIH